MKCTVKNSSSVVVKVECVEKGVSSVVGNVGYIETWPLVVIKVGCNVVESTSVVV